MKTENKKQTAPQSLSDEFGSTNKKAMAPQQDRTKEPMKTIAVRVNAYDYSRLADIFKREKTSLSQAGKIALYYLAEQVEAGELSIPDGVLCRTKNKGV